MAAARAPSARARIALAIAGLILVGALLGWRIAHRPSAPTPIVRQPREQPVAAPSAASREPPRAAVPEVRAEPLQDTTNPETDPDAEASAERDRLAFIRRLNTGDARSRMGPGIPLAVSELIGAGRLREAADALLQMGRDGDANGYHALESLLRGCPGPADARASERRAHDRKAQNQEMIRRMASAGASDDLLERLQWSLDAGNAFVRGTWAEFCPSPEAGDYRALLDEVHRVLPRMTASSHEEQLRTAAREGARPASGVSEAYDREITEYIRGRAEAGVIAAQVQLARRDLLRGDAARKAAAFAVLRGLAPVAPDARADLARCAKWRCTPEAGDPDGARQLALEAARAGSLEALGMLESRPFGMSDYPAEPYAWSQVRHQLHEEGCFGFSRFSTWAFRQALSREDALLDMSPREAELAKRRAAELMASELPAIRARLGCG